MKTRNSICSMIMGAALLLALTPSPWAAADTVSLPDYQAHVASYRAAIDGSQSADEVLTELETWQKNNPNEALVRLYQGAAECLVARDAWMPWTKLRFVNRGMDTMDAAILELEEGVEKAQVSEQDLFMGYVERGMVYANLPSMFKRGDMALEDLTMAMGMPQSQTLSEEFQQRVRSIIERLSDNGEAS